MDIVEGFSVLEVIYLICALVGGVLFVVRLILFIIGMGGDVDVDHGGDVHADSDASFKVLSLQGITAFFLMFGLVGLGLYRNGWLGPPFSVMGGLVAGGGAMLLVAKLFEMMLGLQSAGTVDLKNAVGAEGTVYLNIPAGGGIGKVQVKIQNRLREYEAVSEKGQELKTGTAIRVVWIKGNLLVVEKI